jgi:hypothetical protein
MEATRMKLDGMLTLKKGEKRENPTPTSYRVADKSLAGPGRKQATTTEDFDVHRSYL